MGRIYVSGHNDQALTTPGSAMREVISGLDPDGDGRVFYATSLSVANEHATETAVKTLAARRTNDGNDNGDEARAGREDRRRSTYLGQCVVRQCFVHTFSALPSRIVTITMLTNLLRSSPDNGSNSSTS